MNIIERIEKADNVLATASLGELNFKTIGALRDLLNDAKREISGKKQIFVAEIENDNLMGFSVFTLNEAKKRLTNSFKYSLDNVRGTEFEVHNVTNASAYIVDFRPFTKQASCTCPDFIQRKRICKHIAFVSENVQSVS
jgi:SWIM zinc finger